MERRRDKENKRQRGSKRYEDKREMKKQKDRKIKRQRKRESDKRDGMSERDHRDTELKTQIDKERGKQNVCFRERDNESIVCVRERIKL